MKRIKMALMAMVAVLAIGAVSASAAQATGIDVGSRIGLNGAYCDIDWTGNSLAPNARETVPAGDIFTTACPTGINYAENTADLDIQTTSADLTLHSGTIYVDTWLGGCIIDVVGPVTIPSVSTNHYTGTESVTSPNLVLTNTGWPVCPTSGVVNLDIKVS